MGKGIALNGARVLITGAGSGIGRLMAKGAALRGAQVAIWDISRERADDVAQEIVEAGGTASAHHVDVTHPDAVAQAALQTGAVDVVINNAGVVSGQRLLDVDEAAVERTLQVNLHSLFWVTKAFLPAMVEAQRGMVVTLASAGGLIGVARQTDYSASKFGAVGFTEALRAEMRKDRTGVQTLVVCPFYVRTGMFAGVKSRFPFLLPILEPRDVAVAVLRGIEAGREQIVMPPLVRVIPLLRLFPPPVIDRIADVLGVNATMDTFTGRW